MRLAAALLAVVVPVALLVPPPAAVAQSPAPAYAPRGPERAGTQRRIAFVVGEGDYAAGPLSTAANDAGLVAQTLQAVGFEVVGARDVDAETFRQSYRDFLGKVSAAGPDAVAFVYVAGYGLQYGRDNYLVPVGAEPARPSDVPLQGVRLSDLEDPLDALDARARFLVFDVAYALPFRMAGDPLAGGLKIRDVPARTLLAYNDAPDAVARAGADGYGTYAKSLAEEIRTGGQSPDEVFERVRLRVNEATGGATIPWDASAADPAFRFLERAAGAPAPAGTPTQVRALDRGALGAMAPPEAYAAAVARDDFRSYDEFERRFPTDPLARRVRVVLAARREALTWARTTDADSPTAYWSYLRRYPRGPHAYDARLRLGELASPQVPPPAFAEFAYDVPPPPDYEDAYVDVPTVSFVEASYGLAPPPPPPPYWLPPPPEGFVDLPPPPPPIGLFLLPVPIFLPLPPYYDPPAVVVVPADDYLYGRSGPGGGAYVEGATGGIHGRSPVAGGPGIGAGLVAGAALGVAAAVALPAAVRARSASLAEHGIATPAQLRAARAAPGGLRAATSGPRTTGGPGMDPAVGRAATPPVGIALPGPGTGPVAPATRSSRPDARLPAARPVRAGAASSTGTARPSAREGARPDAVEGGKATAATKAPRGRAGREAASKGRAPAGPDAPAAGPAADARTRTRDDGRAARGTVREPAATRRGTVPVQDAHRPATGPVQPERTARPAQGIRPTPSQFSEPRRDFRQPNQGAAEPVPGGGFRQVQPGAFRQDPREFRQPVPERSGAERPEQRPQQQRFRNVEEPRAAPQAVPRSIQQQPRAAAPPQAAPPQAVQRQPQQRQAPRPDPARGGQPVPGGARQQ